MNSRQAYDEASKTTPVEGDVVVSGPAALDVSLTPRAAKLTGERLIKAAAEAEAQHARHETATAFHNPNMEDHVRQAMIAELERQAAEGEVTFECGEQGSVRINGAVDLDALAMVVVGSVAGGP